MDTYKVKKLADEIAAINHAESWLEEYGETVFHEKNPRFTINLNYAGAVNGQAEAQRIVQEIVNDCGMDILGRALALCATRRRELTGALHAEIGS